METRVLAHLGSCGLARCLTAGFSVFIACFQYVFTGASVGGGCLLGRFDRVPGELSTESPIEKLRSRKSPMTGGMFTPTPQLPSFSCHYWFRA